MNRRLLLPFHRSSLDGSFRVDRTPMPIGMFQNPTSNSAYPLYCVCSTSLHRTSDYLKQDAVIVHGMPLDSDISVVPSSTAHHIWYCRHEEISVQQTHDSSAQVNARKGSANVVHEKLPGIPFDPEFESTDFWSRDSS
jgi:hypothetical protein